MKHQYDEGPLTELEIETQSKKVLQALIRLNVRQQSALVQIVRLLFNSFWYTFVQTCVSARR